MAFTQKDLDILADKTVYEGYFRMKSLQLRHRLFEGDWSDTVSLEIFDRSPVAAVLPYDPDRQAVILIEQFRGGCYQDEHPWLLELVAGVIEPGESPEAMAHRESKEEAGIQLRALHHVYDYWTSPGGSTEKLTLFCGHVDSRHAGGIHGAINEHENIKVHVLSTTDAFALLLAGKIRNAATIIALQWLQLNLDWVFSS